MLAGTRVLIVEDTGIVAQDLAATVELLEGRVIGPVNSVAAGLELVDTEVAGAILDANLADRDVTPLATALIARGIPVVLFTGRGSPAELQRLHPDIPVFLKPASSELVVAALATLIEGAGLVAPAGRTRFFFDIWRDATLTADQDGILLADIATARSEAAQLLGETARDLLMKKGPALIDFHLSVDVRDEAGRSVHAASLVYASRR